ncbi:MAG: succinyldiaminopimelate transaminase [Micrococcales bacterium]|nr:succinyldiaminopimelate transaminase [Micrococcales bacterium]
MPLDLPDFPWDELAAPARTAREHPDGIVDLSVGSPVDPTPEVVRVALAAATDAHGYPATAGTPALREAIVAWFARRRGVTDLTVEDVLPTIGSKEIVALLPTLLGLGAEDVIVRPTLAYPTYAVGAALAGARSVAADDPDDWPEGTRLVWLNTPRNPDGDVLSVPFLARVVERAREVGAIVASDECYAELDWRGEGPSPSVLDPQVTGGTRRGILSVYSLSKQSNLAGYRSAFVAGGRDLVARLLLARKHAGLIPPAPVQAATAAALGDDAHVRAQRRLYRARRERLAAALAGAGFRLEGGDAGLYLWATRDEDCWASVAALADRGILVAPGSFYGAAGAGHVRVALTATDERIDAAVRRLS